MAVKKVGRYAQKLNLDIEKGATFDVTLTYKDENEVVINLTGYTARLQIRDTQDAASFIHEMTTANGGIVLGGVAGTIQLIISDTDTTAFTETTGVYDLELISSGGAVTRLVEGTVTFYEEVTR